MNVIKDTKAAQEIPDLKDFSDMLLNDSARASYGPKHVEVGHEEYMAIQALLITDDLFRNTDIPTRRKLAHLVKSVKDSGKLLVYFHQCTFQESRWQCIPASLQIFDFLCRTLNILRCNEQSTGMRIHASSNQNTSLRLLHC
ncbi:protein PELOTA 1-like [Populus alba x Populus x berolinensis]|nr:protein PELOTA 1-like [Populus alba x Populus x berolinensis]